MKGGKILPLLTHGKCKLETGKWKLARRMISEMDGDCTGSKQDEGTQKVLDSANQALTLSSEGRPAQYPGIISRAPISALSRQRSRRGVIRQQFWRSGLFVSPAVLSVLLGIYSWIKISTNGVARKLVGELSVFHN